MQTRRCTSKPPGIQLLCAHQHTPQIRVPACHGVHSARPLKLQLAIVHINTLGGHEGGIEWYRGCSPTPLPTAIPFCPRSATPSARSGNTLSIMASKQRCPCPRARPWKHACATQCAIFELWCVHSNGGAAWKHPALSAHAQITSSPAVRAKKITIRKKRCGSRNWVPFFIYQCTKKSRYIRRRSTTEQLAQHHRLWLSRLAGP